MEEEGGASREEMREGRGGATREEVIERDRDRERGSEG